MIIAQILALVLFGFPHLQLAGGGLSTRFGFGNVINVVCYMLASPISANFSALAYLHFFRRSQIEVFD